VDATDLRSIHVSTESHLGEHFLAVRIFIVNIHIIGNIIVPSAKHDGTFKDLDAVALVLLIVVVSNPHSIVGHDRDSHPIRLTLVVELTLVVP